MRCPDLVQPGLRRNPRRAHLLVSTVLGKHMPTDRRRGHRVPADDLGELVRRALGAGLDVVVLGFAETATGLGHCVATRLRRLGYLHSTRRDVPGAPDARRVRGGALARHEPPDAADLRRAVSTNDLPLVLVDDEISTGATALDAIRASALADARVRAT